MSDKEPTFGRAISDARKKFGWNQKQLALKILREDKDPISPQYLNDIEHDRRSPSSDHMVRQFATVLKMDADWLFYLVGKFPTDVRERRLTETEFARRMVAFRKEPGRK
jgi:transcriptional regulator with XRE-family HTH domain